jgi:hypothetical protein
MCCIISEKNLKYIQVKHTTSKGCSERMFDNWDCQNQIKRSFRIKLICGICTYLSIIDFHYIWFLLKVPLIWIDIKLEKLYMLIHTNINFLPNFDPNNLYHRSINEPNVDLIIPLSWRTHELYKYIDWLLSRNVSARDRYYWLHMDLGQLSNLSGKNYIKRTCIYYNKALARI